MSGNVSSSEHTDGALAGFNLGQPLSAGSHHTLPLSRHVDSPTPSSTQPNAAPAVAAFSNPESTETKVAEQELVARALGADAQKAPVHTFDPDASPIQKAAETATSGLLGNASRLGSSGIGGIGKLGSTGFGAVQKIGSTGLGTVQKVGSTGLGTVQKVGATGLDGVEKIGSTGLAGVQMVGSTGLAGVQMVGAAGIDGIGMITSTGRALVGANGRADNDGAHSLAVDLSTSEDAPAVIGLEEDQQDSDGANGDKADGGTVKERIIGWLDAVGERNSGTTISAMMEQAGRDPKGNLFTVLIPPSFYGTAYHNAAIIILAVLTTRVMTLFHMGWAWIIILLACCMSVYSISIERTRNRARDDIQRELTKVRLVEEAESADWINSLLDRAWLIAEPLLSATVVAMVDDILEKAPLPPGLDGIRMTTFTLGNKAPKIDSIRTYPKTPDDEIIMEWAISFTPNDLEDLTPKEARNKVNPKIALSIRVGKGVVGAGLPILLEDISFVGKLRMKLKLMSNFPHVQTVQVSFMEKPDFDYVLKPLTAFDVNSIPGLSSLIKEQVHANLGPMMYDPNIFTINLEQLLSGRPLDSAIGVLKVTIESARGLKATKLGGNDPDPYVLLSLGSKANLAKSATKRSTKNPKWQEQHWLLLNSVTDTLRLSIYDYNEHRNDSLLGELTCELSRLLEDSEIQNQVGKIMHEGKDRGEIQYSLAFYPVLVPKQLEDGTVEEPADVKEGIVRLAVHQAKDLDLARGQKAPTTHAQVYLRGKPIFSTPVIKHSNAPTYGASTEFLVADKDACHVTVAIIDDKASSGTNPVLGKCSLRLSKLLASQEEQQEWYDMVHKGKIRLTVDWKPLEIPGGLTGNTAWKPPIGIMRILCKRAVDVKNVDLGGKSDPYCRVISGNTVTGRTQTIDDDLSPTWNSYIYAPVHNIRDRLILEVMDYENTGKDRSLGTVGLSVADFVSQSGTDYTSKGKQDRQAPIVLPKSGGHDTQGVLSYEADFVPCVRLKGSQQFPEITNAPLMLKENASASLLQGDYTHLRKSSIRSSRTFSHRTFPSTDSFAVDIPPIPEKKVLKIEPTGTDVPAISEKEVLKTEPTASIDGGASEFGSRATSGTEREVDAGFELSTEELLRQEHGVLVMRIHACQLAHKARLEVVLDENYWPVYSSDKPHSRDLAEWNQTAECYIRELPWSQIILRMNDANEDQKEDIDSSVKFATRDLIAMSLEQPRVIEMRSKGGEVSKILVSCKYIPVDVVLEARESLNNMGNLRVDLIDGQAIRSADRNGKSDPYVVFYVNGERIFKSDVQRKTLTPRWNEHFETQITSRVDDVFEVEVYDWNQFETAKSLGKGSINLAELEPFLMKECDVPLTSEKHGTHGSVRIRLVFSPGMIMRSRRNTSTFSGAGRAVTTVGTTVGAIPLGVGKGVGKGVFHSGKGIIHGVGSTVGFAGRKTGLIKKKDKNGDYILVPETGEAIPEVTETTVTEPNFALAEETPLADHGHGVPQTPLRRPTNLTEGNREPSLHEGKAEAINITCVKATLDGPGSHEAKPYVQLTLGHKSYKTGHAKRVAESEWNETFKFSLEENESRLNVKVLDRKTLGKDREIGQVQIDISNHIQPGAGPSTEIVNLENGQGQVVLHFEPLMGAQMDSHRTPSIASKSGKGVAPSPSSRFSFKHKN